MNQVTFGRSWPRRRHRVSFSSRRPSLVRRRYGATSASFRVGGTSPTVLFRSNKWNSVTRRCFRHGVNRWRSHIKSRQSPFGSPARRRRSRRGGYGYWWSNAHWTSSALTRSRTRRPSKGTRVRTSNPQNRRRSISRRGIGTGAFSPRYLSSRHLGRSDRCGVPRRGRVRWSTATTFALSDSGNSLTRLSPR